MQDYFTLKSGVLPKAGMRGKWMRMDIVREWKKWAGEEKTGKTKEWQVMNLSNLQKVLKAKQIFWKLWESITKLISFYNEVSYPAGLVYFVFYLLNF